MNTRKETFNKSERLCSRKIITSLFENGNVFYTKLFKIVWSKSLLSLPAPAQVAFSVSKKSFRLAVTRNLLKRRIREAYRRNKQMLYDCLNRQNMQVVFIVIYKEAAVSDFREIEDSLKEMIDRFSGLINKTDKEC
jgi:ribonuclease P protein component